MRRSGLACVAARATWGRIDGMERTPSSQAVGRSKGEGAATPPLVGPAADAPPLEETAKKIFGFSGAQTPILLKKIGIGAASRQERERLTGETQTSERQTRDCRNHNQNRTRYVVVVLRRRQELGQGKSMTMEVNEWPLWAAAEAAVAESGGCRWEPDGAKHSATSPLVGPAAVAPPLEEAAHK